MRHIEGTADMTALRGAGNGRCAGGVISAGRMRNALATIAVVGSVGLIPATSSMSATPGLVAAYGFEEGSGDSIADVSGGGHDGSIVNATWAQSGVYGMRASLRRLGCASDRAGFGGAAPGERDDTRGVGQTFSRE